MSNGDPDQDNVESVITDRSKILSGYPTDAVEDSYVYTSEFMIYRMRRTYNTSGHGEAPMTWYLIDTVAGRVRELNAHERLNNESRKDKLTHKCYCSPTADIQRNDVVVVLPALEGGVNTFLVGHAHLPGNIQHHYEINAKSIVSDSIEWAGYMLSTPKGLLEEES